MIRPDIAGLMGAFGAALIAAERYEAGVPSTLLGPAELDALEIRTSITRPKGCGNSCLLTVNRF